MSTPPQSNARAALLRHPEDAVCESSTCGTRKRLISDGDEGVQAWAHTVDLQDGAPHYHRIATEIYYILEGHGTITLDGRAHRLKPGSIVHIPPRVVHATTGPMKALIVGIPDIRDDDVYFPNAPDTTA